MEHDVYLIVARTGRSHAHVPTLIGCNWTAPEPEAAEERAAPEIDRHLAWLRSHGLPAPPAGEPVHPRLIRQRSTGREGGLVGFFATDREPVTAAEVDGFIRQMACARADLLALTHGLSDALLDRAPAPGSWPIRQILRHVAGAEQWYLTRILGPGNVPRLRPSRSVWERLERTRALALEHLQALSEAQRSELIATQGEMWTARKVFRRFLEHEREHQAHVLEVLGAIGDI